MFSHEVADEMLTRAVVIQRHPIPRTAHSHGLQVGTSSGQEASDPHHIDIHKTIPVSSLPGIHQEQVIQERKPHGNYSVS